MWVFQLAGLLFVAVIVAAGAAWFRRWRLAVAVNIAKTKAVVAIHVGGMPILECVTTPARIAKAMAYGITRMRRRFATQTGSIG